VTLLVACGVAIVDVSQPDKMQHKSVKSMLAVYDQAREHPLPIPAANAPNATLTLSNAPLIFVGVRPFSAEFYSRGEAIRVSNEAEGWRRVGTGAAYVATRFGDLFIAGAAPDTRTGGSPIAGAAQPSTPARQVARIGHYGDFDLLFVAAR
jgi:hypothetical protein